MTVPAGFQALCLDAVDVPVVAEFWASALGHVVRQHGQGPADLSGGHGPRIWVNPVPEAKAVKNRVHVDLALSGPDPAPLLALGATVLREPTGEHGWWVLADPEGNEFCAFPAEPDASNDADAEVAV